MVVMPQNAEIINGIMMPAALENIVKRELNRRGFTQSVALACPNCIPKTLADDIDGRMIDMLNNYNELLAKALLEPNQVKILDASGNMINSISDKKKAFDLMMREYYVVFEKSDTTSWVKYLASIRSGLSKSGIEAVIDTDTKSLSITVSRGTLTGKLINVDLSKLYEKMKLYFTGGGIATLGYIAGTDEQNSKFKITPIYIERMEALSNLNSQEKDKLIEAANVKYIEELFYEYTKN
jgi:hypothetical protein